MEEAFIILVSFKVLWLDNMMHRFLDFVWHSIEASIHSQSCLASAFDQLISTSIIKICAFWDLPSLRSGFLLPKHISTMKMTAFGNNGDGASC